MMAKDRFYGEWGAHFPKWPLPIWATNWPEDEGRVQQLIKQCNKRVADLEAELERERFSLEFLHSFGARTAEGKVTSEDKIRVQPDSGLVDSETVVNGVTNDVEESEDVATAVHNKEPEKATRQCQEGGMTRENCSDDKEVSEDDIDNHTLFLRHLWERQGAIRHSSISSPTASVSGSPSISPKPAPRYNSAFPLSVASDTEDRRRSSSTGNLPLRTGDVPTKRDRHSASSSPRRRRMKTSVSMFDFGDCKEAVKERAAKGGDKGGRRNSKGHRPRSINLGPNSEVRETIRRKKHIHSDGSHSDDSVLSSVSTDPNIDEGVSEHKDNNVVLVLPANAIVASPSEDIFRPSVGLRGVVSHEREKTASVPFRAIGKRVEPVNLMSPDHSLRTADINKRESSFLDTLPRDGSHDDDNAFYPMLSKQDSNQSVQLDEVSMTIYDDCEDEFLYSDDGELYSSYSDTEEKEGRICDENKESHSEENVDICEEQSIEGIKDAGAEESSSIAEPLRSEDVIRRKRPCGLISGRRSGGISDQDWTQLHGEMKQGTELEEFYQSQLQALNDQDREREELEADGAYDGSHTRQWSPLCRVSKSSSLSPRVRTPSPSSRQPNDQASYALRKMIVSTFLDKEQAYIDHLNLVCQHYHKPLAAVATTSQPMLSSRDCDVVFYKQEELLRIHRQLVEAIEGRLSQWSSDQTVAECFGILVDALPLYKSYFENYQIAVELLNKRKTELPQFAQFVDSAAQMKAARHRVPLEELLRKPVDKLQNYSLVLKDLLKYTPRDHGDFDLLLRTSQAVSDLLKSINQGPAETEGKRPLKSEVVVQLTENGRKFRQLCLFEDVLLCVKQKGSGRQRKYECKWYLPLTELTFHPPPDAEVPGPITRTNSQELESLQAKIGKLKHEIRQEQTEKRKGSKLTAVRSSSKLDRLKKKLRELEASLRLSKADLPLRLFDIEGKAYTLLFCESPERIGWQEDIATTKETAKPVQISPYDLEALITCSRKTLRQSDSMRSIQIEADIEEEFLSGILHVQVHSARGIVAARQGKPDLFCTLSVDCYGRFDRKAKTHVMKESAFPVWEEEFDIEVEGTQNMKIACFDRRNVLMEDQCGRGQVELLKLGVKDGRKHPVEVKLMPKGSVKLSVTYVTRVQSLSRNLSSSDSGLFGVPIGVLCQREATQVPHIVTCCCEEIERRGLDEIGIYRVSGVASDVKSLKQAFEQDPSEATKMAAEIDIHVVSGLLKMFFRELPEPLFTDELYPHLVDGIALGEPEAKQRFMASLVQSLPPVNLVTMVYLFRHLRKVASEENVNKMSLNNLSTVFGPNLLRPAMDGNDYAAIAAMAHVGILLYLLQVPEKLLLSPSAQASSSLTQFQFPTIEEELDSESVQ